MAEEPLIQRQEEEWQVLQAVYMEDVVDLRKKVAWKVERPLHICLTLKQQQSESVAGKTDIDNLINMVVKCSSRYPEVVPDIKLENAKGVSNEQIAILKEELEKKAQSLIGEVMILELAQHAQTFLRDNYKGPQKSFYEEMLNNQRKQQEKVALEHKKRLEFLRKKEEKERQLLEDEIQKRHNALKEETKKRKEAKNMYEEKITEQEKNLPSTPVSEVPTCSPIGTPSTPRRPRISYSPSPLIVNQNNETKLNHDKRRRRTSTPRRDSEGSDGQCKDHTGGIVVLAFNTKTERTIHRGTCLGHSVHGSTVYAGIDTTSGELVAISEWVLKWRHISKKKIQKPDYDDKDGAFYLKQVTSVEQEIHSLIRLRHKNLIHYLAIKYIQEVGKCVVYILMEYSGGASLNIHVTESRPLSVDTIKSYAEEILSGLEYLHNKDVVHKNLRISSVFVDKNGRIRLSDYSIDKRLSDLYYTVESSRPGVHFTDDRGEIPPGRGGKKGDIYQMGLILLSIAQGMAADSSKPEIPQTLPAVFQDFLTKCLMKDERHRWSVHQLLEHSFIKEELPHTIHYLPHKSTVTGDGDKKTEDKKADDSEDDDYLADIPYITALEASGQSRLTNEFEVLRSLGKGGFGDVIEVRNKLDRRKYAIKRIPLNPKSKYFNKKITREVKLLSRLNHENVVRYYNSWIETSEDPADSDSSTSTSATTGTDKTTPTSTSSLVKNSLNMTDDIENLAPQANDVSVDWSMSYNTTGAQKIGELSDSEDEADVFGRSFFGTMDTSEDIMFEHSSSDKSDDEESGINKSSKVMEPVPVAKLQYLYIQMEFCERSTLRNCIDAGLFLDINRLWRFFREIVEGLVHIHEQGMIHRDLKPVNIFLDSNDHVKIGDFGLATTSVLASQPNIDTTMFSISALECHGDATSKSMSDGAGDLTGKVGTALYVSPEMMTGAGKMSYSQKVDMYSLGVIFFEMCYKPLPTGMERVKVLANLRSKEVIFPEDFDQLELKNQTSILQMLMNHDPSQRPTSAELLKSEFMPPPQLEEAEQNEIMRSTISDPQSKTYKRLIGGLFSQTITPADDHLYDSEFHKGGITIKTALTNELVYENLIRIFQKHGAVPVLSPLLMPKGSVYDNTEIYPCFMDHSGLLVALPFDLRAPFARYIARNNIVNLKRYCIGKVYRTKRFHKQHPRELTECAFDIVSPSQGSLIPDAEMLIVVQEVVNEFPALQRRSYYVKMNHVTILRAVLMHAGVPDNLFEDTLTALSGPNIDSKIHTKSLKAVGLTEQIISSILSILEMEGPFGKISSFLRCITKTKGEAASLAKQGLHELETVMNHAVSMGLKLQMIVSLGFLYSVHQYSGVIFQVIFDHRMKNRNIPDVLAVGGSYSNLISKFHSLITHSLSQQYSITQHAVGVSFHFEKIISALLENPEYQCKSRCDILVCAIGHKSMLKDRMTIIKHLWAAGLKAELLLDTVQTQEDIQDMCRSAGISHIVMLKDGDHGFKVRSLEKDKITEKKIGNELLLTEFLLHKIQSNKIEQNEIKGQSGQCNATLSQPHSESVPSQSNHSNMTLTFTFIMMEGKLALNSRRKYELQIYGKVTTCLSWLPGKSCDVIAVELTGPVIKTIAAYLEMNGSEKDFHTSISSIIEKQPRHRKYLSHIFDQIFEFKFERKNSNDKGCDFLVLYGLKDDSVKLLS